MSLFIDSRCPCDGGDGGGKMKIRGAGNDKVGGEKQFGKKKKRARTHTHMKKKKKAVCCNLEIRFVFLTD